MLHRKSWTGRTPIVLITLLGMGLRVAFLGRQSLWYDEAYSWAVAVADWPTFWAALLSDGVHPPGYYLLLRGCMALWGNSEYGLRFLSAGAGTLTVPLMWRLGQSLGDKRWGLAASALLALNPFALWYAQEARMYSLLLCLTVISGYTFWKMTIRPNWSCWLWLTLATAGGLAVHYVALVFSLAQFVYLVVSLRRNYRALRWWTLSQGVAFLSFVPWAIAVATREGRNFGIGWIHPPTLLDLPLTLVNLGITLSDPAAPSTWVALALLGAATGTGISILIRRKTALSTVPFLLAWLAMPLVFVWLLSLRLPLYVDRFLIISLPSLVLLISANVLSPAWLTRGIMVVLVAISVVASVRLWGDPNLSKEDWRTATGIIQAGEKPGDLLVVRDLQTGIPFRYYYDGMLAPQPLSVNRQTTSLSELVCGHSRVWIVYRRPFEATHMLAGSTPFTWHDDTDPVTSAWLAVHRSSLVQEITLPGVYIILYELAL